MKYFSNPTYKTTIIFTLLLLIIGKIIFNKDWESSIKVAIVLATSGIFHFLFKKIISNIHQGFYLIKNRYYFTRMILSDGIHTFSDIRNSFIIGLIVLLIVSNLSTGIYGTLSLILLLFAIFIIRSIIRWNNLPVFNPVAIASLLLIFTNQVFDTGLFIGWEGVNYSIELLGERINFGTYISIFGALISIFYSKKYLYTIAFFTTFLLLGYPLLGVEGMNYLLLDGTIYFFFGIMILEPKTGVSGKYQWIYGVILGLILVGVLKFHINGDYILVICLINLVYFIGKNYVHKQNFTGVAYPKGQKWICVPCGYIYNPIKGDTDTGIAPGTEFIDIPDSWFCPVCGVTKADFIPLDTSIRYQAEIQEKTFLNPVTLKLVIRIPNTLPSIAGQFISFYWKDSEGEFIRYYSIAEQIGDTYIFLIKLTEKGRGAKILRDIKVGEKIELHGISGEFKLQNTENPKIFIATGTGLAPIYRMIQSLPESTKKTLYFTVATKNELFYLEELSRIKNLNYFIHLSKENISGFYFGRINIDTLIANEKTEWYLCGNPSMVKETTDKLKKRGFEMILSEEFN